MSVQTAKQLMIRVVLSKELHDRGLAVDFLLGGLKMAAAGALVIFQTLLGEFDF